MVANIKVVIVLVQLTVPALCFTTSCGGKEVIEDAFTFINEPETEQITVRLGHYAELLCCATSFSKINWYKEDGQTWKPFLPEPSHINPLAPTFAEEGQVLVFRSAEESDEGNYKCVLETGGKEVDKRQLKLTVAECDELARGPYPIAPLPCETTSVTLGETVTLPCNGYFGCGDDYLRTVMWLVTEADGPPNWRDASEVSNRYQIKYSKSNGNSEIGASFTITDVQAEDMERKFMCLLSTPQIIHGESKLFVRLQHDRRTNKDPTVDSTSVNTIIVVVGGFVFLVTLTLGMVFSFLCHRKIRNRRTREQVRNEKELMFSASQANESV